MTARPPAPRGAPLRFIIAGGFNTVATFVLYVSLLTVLTHPVAYSITFGVGIMLSYLLNRVFVFRARGGMSTMLLFPMVYVVQYLVGLGVVVIWVDLLGLPAELASIAAVVATLPLTYVLLRWVFVARHEATRDRDTAGGPVTARPLGTGMSETPLGEDD